MLLYKLIKNATSLEEFKNKKYRYQLTDYAREIERLVIALEDMEVKTASLEPKLFDRIRISITNLEQINSLDENLINELWNNLNDDFTKLHQNYQDYLKQFNTPASFELLQSEYFLDYKSLIIALDEAFAGVDEENIREMFGILKYLDLNFIINSQVLWGDYDTVSKLSICELIRPQNSQVVTVERYRWNGKYKEIVNDRELFNGEYDA